MITVINFAEGYPYERYQHISSKTAKIIGKADSVIEYHYKDIPRDYIEKHKSIFSRHRGIGLWLWKPFLIYKTLKQMPDGEWLFYVDGGTFFINKINQIVKCAEEYDTDLMLFEIPLLSRQFTKKECYDFIGINDFSQNQLAAGYILIKKSFKSISFIKEWLELCEHENLLAPEKYNGDVEEFPDFVSHREDQSLLTLLRIKYNIPVFRDCSDFGEFPHMYFSCNYSYNPKKYNNSTFPTILLSNRRSNPYLYFVRYMIKHILWHLGLINANRIIAKKIKQGI